MISLGSDAKVFLALGATDMRKGIDGLALLVSQQLERDPFSGHVFAFCNRQKTTIKMLIWDRNCVSIALIMARGNPSKVQFAESKDVLLQRIAALETYISELEENVRLLKSAIFGRSSEKQRPADPVPGQLCLPFEEAAPIAVAEVPSTKTTVLEHQRRKR